MKILTQKVICLTYFSKLFVDICCCSVAKSCLILCDPRDCSMLSFPILHCLPEFAQCPLSQWCYLTISSSAAPFFWLQFFPASVFSSESALCISWPKYWSFSISPSREYSGLISRFLCNIVLYNIGFYFHHQTHLQLNIISALASNFILSGTISNCPVFFTSRILGTFHPGGLSSSVITFCLFILSMGFSWQEYWNDLPFSPPVDHVLSELCHLSVLSGPAQHNS